MTKKMSVYEKSNETDNVETFPFVVVGLLVGVLGVFALCIYNKSNLGNLFLPFVIPVVGVLLLFLILLVLWYFCSILKNLNRLCYQQRLLLEELKKISEEKEGNKSF